VIREGSRRRDEGRRKREETTTHLVPRSVLSSGDEKVDVVGPDEILSETDDGSRQTDFSVMVGGLLGNESSELSDLCLKRNRKSVRFTFSS